MNLAERLPFRKGLPPKIIRERIRKIEQGQRQRRMPYFYELIAICEEEDFIKAAEGYSICPSFFNMRCTCTRNSAPIGERDKECEKCWRKCINQSKYCFGQDLMDEKEDLDYIETIANILQKKRRKVGRRC